MKFKPYHLLFAVAMLLLILSYFTAQNTIDIYLYDTYYIIGVQFILWVIALISLMLGVIYWLKTSKTQ